MNVWTHRNPFYHGFFYVPSGFSIPGPVGGRLLMRPDSQQERATNDDFFASDGSAWICQGRQEHGTSIVV
jgi:hypothetical protein